MLLEGIINHNFLIVFSVSGRRTAGSIYLKMSSGANTILQLSQENAVPKTALNFNFPKLRQKLAMTEIIWAPILISFVCKPSFDCVMYWESIL